MTRTNPQPDDIVAAKLASEQAHSSLTDQILDAFLEQVESDSEIPSTVGRQLRVAFTASSLRQPDVDRAFEAAVNEEPA